MTSFTDLSATEIAALVRTKQTSATEVTTAFLARQKAINPSINAIVQPSYDAAMAQAVKVDATIERGENAGLLAGVPVTIKVNVDQAGFATTNGLRIQAENIADSSSPFVENLDRNGAVFVGRTNTPAFSLRWFTNNQLHGQTLNPQNAALTPGGSSGGAASSVAAGLCAIAHGTDIAGSIRYPAYACGVHGLRPSFGCVPTFNATSGDRFIGGQIMAVSGPIARSIDDIRLALMAMSGMVHQDPWSFPTLSEQPTFEKRAAFCPLPDGLKVVPEVATALDAAARALEAAGWDVEEISCPPLREAADINAVLWMAETKFAADSAVQEEGDGDAQFVFDQMCRSVGDIDLERVMCALQRRSALIREWEEFLGRYPVLICPISAELPFEQQLDVRSEGDFERVYEAQLTQRGLPVLGMPALAVATGMADQSPVGVQLVAGRFREDILLDAGAILEARFGVPAPVDPA